MRYIENDKRHFVLYIHVFTNLEGWGYYLKKYPQIQKVKLKDWQIEILLKELEKEALKNNWILRH
jgi:hypothetical protein